MPIFQVLTPLSPIIYSIDGDTFNEGVKNFVKLHYNLSLMNLIISDQQRHYKANMKYYKKDGKRKVGIDYYPVPGLYFN